MLGSGQVEALTRDRHLKGIAATLGERPGARWATLHFTE
jgi:hypothetical protein